MKTRIQLISVLVALLAFAPGLQAAEIAGVHFDAQGKVGDANMLLNGAGLRSKFFIKVYAMGMYMPSKTSDATLAINQPGPKRIQIVTLRDVGADMFVEGLIKGIEKNTEPTEINSLRARMDQLTATLKNLPELKKGSVVNLEQWPNGSTRLSINGQTIGKEIYGEDFYRALMRIWLGAEPVQDDLKHALLGR